MQWLVLISLLPYVYLLLRIYAYLLKIRPHKPVKEDEVSISVIVACRNEEKNIPSLLSCLSSQIYNADLFEVVVIDDNSCDSTIETASSFREIKNLKVLRNKGLGKKQAVRTGIEACSGELVVTTDADCRFQKEWLNAISVFYSEYKPEMIICPVQMKGSEGFFQRFQELEFLSLQGVTAGTSVSGNPVMCNGANLAFTKEIYQKHASFLHEDKVSGDDIFLLHSVKEGQENKILWLESTEAIVTTPASPDWVSFAKQRVRWISKAGAYRDNFSRILAIVTFVTILIQPVLLVSGIFDPSYLLVFAAAFLLKSVPDYLILRNTTLRYGRRNLMKWFLPSQLFYSIYILYIVPSAMFKGNRWYK